MGRVGAGVRKSLATVLALERLLAGVYALVLLEVMLELEGLTAVAALELAQVGSVLVVRHMTLQLRQRGELLATQGARLK